MDAESMREFSGRAAAVGGSLWPGVVLLGGVEYAATVPEPRVQGSLVPGGEIGTGELVVRILKSVLVVEPGREQVLQWKRPAEAGWRTPKWWVDTVEGSPLDVEWVLRCSVKN